MLSINKKIAFGVAALAATSLVGCKDDDDDACNGVTAVTFPGGQQTTLPVTLDAACNTCVYEKLDYPTCTPAPLDPDDACTKEILEWFDSAEDFEAKYNKAFEDCGGSSTPTTTPPTTTPPANCNGIDFKTTSIGGISAPQAAINFALTTAGGADANSGCLDCLAGELDVSDCGGDPVNWPLCQVSVQTAAITAPVTDNGEAAVKACGGTWS